MNTRAQLLVYMPAWHRYHYLQLLTIVRLRYPRVWQELVQAAAAAADEQALMRAISQWAIKYGLNNQDPMTQLDVILLLYLTGR